jgi:hypothetical protein
MSGLLRLRTVVCGLLAVSLLASPATLAAPGGSAVQEGSDVKVTDDNRNRDGGLANVTPSKDAQNRQSNEPTVSVSGAASPVTGAVGDIIAAGANDYRMVPHFGDAWMPVYLSFDGGATWFGAAPFPSGFNTMVPGFPTDTSADGINSPLKNLDGSGDPVVRFDAAGNLYVAGIAFNRNFDQPDKPVDNLVYVAKYTFTPGTPATASTTTTAGSPPHFTYAFTTVVDRGAVGFAVPNQPFGFAGEFTDKEWMEIDLNSPASSPCAGSIYVSFTSFHGLAGSFPIVFSRSADGGASFSKGGPISTGGQEGTVSTQGSDIAVAPNGTVYVSYRTFASQNEPARVQVVKSTDCGQHWSNPVTVNTITAPQAPGVAFRTPAFTFIVTDNVNPNIVYVAYQSFAGDYDIYVQRSTNGGATWESAVRVNEDPGARHQIWPTIEVSNGALHVAWYDFRNSRTDGNEALDVYYACTNCSGVTYPTFIPNVRVTDTSHQPNCQMFGGGSVAFHGDYIELDARWNGSGHTVQVVWTDNRDVPNRQCDLTPGPGPTNSIGNRNQNIYTDVLTVSP